MATGDTVSIDFNVTIDSPLPNANLFTGQSITVNGTATYEKQNLNDGTTQVLTSQIDKLEVKLGSDLVKVPAKLNGSSWSTWSTSFTMAEAKARADPNGKVTITATATEGATLADEFSVTVNVDNIKPEIKVTSHNDGAIVNLTDGTIILKGTASDPQSGVKDLKFKVDSGLFQLTTATSANFATWQITVPLTSPGKHTITLRGEDNQQNVGEEPFVLDVALPFYSTDPQDMVGEAAYLSDLTLFASYRVSAGPTPDTLRDIFCQRFDALRLDDHRHGAHQPVHQARVAVEVLRRYIEARGVLASSTAQALLQEKERAYVQDAYEAALRHLGTSPVELRLARGADEATRAALAERLGVDLPPDAPEDPFVKLLLAGDALTEANLESLFGLADTIDPFGGAAPAEPTPLLTLQETRLRRIWREQDEAARGGNPDAPPIIDPDVVQDADLYPIDASASTLVQKVHTLWEARQSFVQSTLSALKSTREQATAQAASQAKGFQAIVEQVLGAGAIDQLVQLESRQTAGYSIAAELRALRLTLPAFSYLLRIHKLAAAEGVLDEEWNDVYSLLTQVEKIKQFPAWRGEEGGNQEDRKDDITLSPDCFKLPDPSGLTPLALPAFRARAEVRRTWEDTLRARADQDTAIAQALQAAVEGAESETLPRLRDGLIEVLGSDKVEALTQELFVDFKAGGSQQTTRLQQAIETLQSILFAVRTGHIASITPVAGTNPAKSWRLVTANGYNEIHFDEEWQWIGTHATWRAAMMVFLDPENPLLPTLRPASSQTKPFTDFIGCLRGYSHLTPAAARAEAQKYLEALRNEPGMTLPAPISNPAFQISDQLTAEQSELWKNQPQSPQNVVQEVFFFVPVQLALQLERSAEYLAALDWYQLVYAYHLPATAPGRKVYRGLKDEESIPTHFQRTVDWLLEGLNPHDIAAIRANTYTRFTLLSVARCLIAFADDQFTAETRESLPRARALYAAAWELVDKQPELTTPPTLSDGSQLPSNPIAVALHTRADVGLQRLRNGLNILGMERSESSRPTPYRYSVLAERAKQMLATAQQIEAAFLAALEKRDAEAYNLLKAQQDKELTGANVALQELRQTEARHSKQLAIFQKDRALMQAEHFDNLLEAGKSGWEKAALATMGISAAVQGVLGIAALVAAPFTGGLSSAAAAPFLMGALGVTTKAATPGALASFGLSSLQSGASSTASFFSTMASFERREQEWRLQRSLARQDVAIGNQQITLAQDHQTIVEKEHSIAQTQEQHAKDTADFLANKFTSFDLFDWMSGVLEEVYRFFLQHATAMAKLAERQLRFERQENLPSFIQSDYWRAPEESVVGANGSGPDRRGLTGSARLSRDLTRLDQHAFETDQRKLQLTKTLSLAQMAPVEIQRFRETGVMVFAMPMESFDRDFPGHYLRLIKRVRTSVIALIPPTHGVRATLTCAGVSRVVVDDQGFRTVAVGHGSQSVALSSPINASGLFEPDTQPEMLQPFEGIGVDTLWEISMPKAANPFDYRTIADVLVTLDYTALDSPVYRQQVIRSLNPHVSMDRTFSFRHQFSDQWYDLHNPDQTATPMTVRFKTERQDFPPNIEELKIKQVLLYFAPANGQPVDIRGVHLGFKTHGEQTFVGGTADSIDGIISTRQGNGENWATAIIKPEPGKSPIGEWELTLPEEMRERFKNEQLEDLLFVITYAGCTPGWPT